MGFAVHHLVSLLDGGLTNGLRQVAFAGSAGAEKKGVSRLPMKPPVARPKTRLRFIFGLKVKSKLSSVLWASRKLACLRRRSSNLPDRRVNTSEIRHEIRSTGAMGSA